MLSQDIPSGAPVLSLARVGAVAASNALEFYDFLVYVFFANQIGKSFFPASSNESLMLVLATFGVGFLTRPLGGMVIGIMGDTRGRKPALLLSLALMGFATTGIALTPPFASIGMAAPVLAILFRLLQGFALGGEVGPASAYLMEAAPASRRGFYISLQFSGQWIAGLAAAVGAMLLSHAMSEAAFTQWGWRIALLAGVVVVPAGLWVRWRLPETLMEDRDIEAPPVSVQFRQGLLSGMTLAGGSVATYVLSYLTTFGNYTLDISRQTTFAAAILCGICGSAFSPLGGALSDRFGRKPVMLAALGLLLVAVLPCFKMMIAWQSPGVLLADMAVMTSLLALSTPPALAILLESLPPRSRSGGTGIIYGLAISIFGGTTPFIITGLIDTTESSLAPAWYMAAALLLAIAGAAATHESAPVRTGR